MANFDISESIWARGRKDAKSASLSFLFLFVEAGGTVMIGVITQDPWVSLIFFFGLLAALWAGATVRSPICQRDEARSQIIEGKKLSSLCDRIEDLHKDIRLFIMEYETSKPAPYDALNYSSSSMSGTVKISGSSNIASGPDSDAFQVRMIKNLQDERMNHKRKHLNIFHDKFVPKALSRLRKAKDLGAISTDQFSQFEKLTQQDFLENAGYLFECVSVLCGEAVQSLKEKD